MMALVMNGEAATVGIWLATFIWYTCVVIPFSRMKQAAVSMLGNSDSKEEEAVEIDDLVNYRRKTGTLREERYGETAEEEGGCCICLEEFEKEEVVRRGWRCRHVFHGECIEKWIDKEERTCPLCRTALFE